MNKLLSILIVIAISGCQTIQSEPDVQVEYKYISKTIPSEHLTIPEQPRSINVEKSTQKDVAKWILETENRMKEMENKLKEIKKLNSEK